VKTITDKMEYQEKIEDNLPEKFFVLLSEIRYLKE
jgi:hypothetical protein